MVIRMKWLSKILGRPEESQEDGAARGSQVPREQADEAETAKPQPGETSSSEPVDPSGSNEQPAP
jgi:hypothetical protein